MFLLLKSNLCFH